MEVKDLTALLGLATTVFAIVTPILKLNSTITKLNANFENMIEQDKKRDESIKEQGKEIEKLHDYKIQHEQEYKSIHEKVEDHEHRINKLENR